MRTIFKDLLESIACWFQSWTFIAKNGLWHYFLYPVAIAIVFSMGGAVLLHHLVDYIMQFIEPHFAYEPLTGDFTEKIKSLLSNAGKYATAFFIYVAGLYLFFSLNKYIVLACMAPVMALLSEKTEEILSQKNYPFNWGYFIKDIIRGIILSLRNFLVETALVLLFWFASAYASIAMPFLSFLILPLISFAGFLTGAYFYGFSVLDYVHERRRLSLYQSIRETRKMKGLAIGTGIIFSLMMFVPFIGTIVATVTVTVAGTMALIQRERDTAKSANQ